MKKSLLWLLSIAAGYSVAFGQLSVTYTITPSLGRSPIGKHIYGFNYSSGKLHFDKEYGYTFTRMGGNRSTAYNWENNASNAGKDFGPNVSDGWWAGAIELPGSDKDKPAAIASAIFERAKSNSGQAIVSLQMAGYVSADNNGQVTQAPPNSRWCEALFSKGSAFSLSPDLSDNKVYMDEYVNFLVRKFGKASEGGILAYGMDNEPDLWEETHHLLYPTKLRCVELVQKTTSLAKAVKAVDATAKIFGLVSFGFDGYLSLHGAPDWSSVKGSNVWFIDYFLDKMKTESATAGTRLVDVLALHWYPEAKGDNRIVETYANSENDKLARLQAPRTLWDVGYLENSWIAKWNPDFLPLLPKLKKSIDTRYPGTELAFTEFQYGGYEDITGAIALTDVLGIFGKYGIYAATHWGTPGSYGSVAYKLFRNYNGAGAVYGDMNVGAAMSDKVNSSLYASVSSSSNAELHIIALNKSMKESIAGVFTISGGTDDYGTASVYAVSGGSASIQKKNDISISRNKFTYTLPALSAFHFVLKSIGLLHGISPLGEAGRNAVSVRSPCVQGRPVPVNLSIRKSSRIRIELYDCGGRLETGKDFGLFEAGNRELYFASPVRAGMYLLRVTIGDEQKTLLFAVR